jgi:hypothetical protein
MESSRCCEQDLVSLDRCIVGLLVPKAIVGLSGGQGAEPDPL